MHKKLIVVCRQLDQETPQPAQRFSWEQFLVWVDKQRQLAEEVVSCYEAGCFGYWPHRQLEQKGVRNYVVRPRSWDEYHQKVKTDQRDAKELVLALSRYVEGNRSALSVVRVPTEAQEQRRSLSRQRQSLHQERQRLAAKGRSHGCYYGLRHSLLGAWWSPSHWEKLLPELSPILLELLEPLRQLIEAVEKALQASTRALEKAAPAGLIKGLGNLSHENIEREVLDWERFRNRRQVSSYTGLCPSEDSSAQRRFQGSINKHGNRRLRPLLIEASWRLLIHQKQYRTIKKWSGLWSDSKVSKGRRKKMIVAIARQFAVDLWRIKTGRTSPEKLGLEVWPLPAPVPAQAAA